MAPELLQPHVVEFRRTFASDVWSYGCVCVEVREFSQSLLSLRYNTFSFTRAHTHIISSGTTSKFCYMWSTEVGPTGHHGKTVRVIVCHIFFGTLPRSAGPSIRLIGLQAQNSLHLYDPLWKVCILCILRGLRIY
jgi:serine/threonine protein kinase